MYLNEFTVAATTRGIMHAVVALGMEPLMGAIAISTGSLTGLHNCEKVDGVSRNAIVKGLQAAVHNLGIAEDVLALPRHIIRCVAEVTV